MPQNSTWDNLLDPFPPARGAAISGFTAFRDISPTPLVASMAGQLVVGTKVTIEAWGEHSGITSCTVQLGIIYNATAGAAGGTTLAANTAAAFGTTPVAWPWHLRYEGLITAIGSAGTIDGMGLVDVSSSLVAMTSTAMPVTAAARIVTIDTTLARPLWGIGAALGVSSGSNIVTCYGYNVEIMNQGKTS
jgi:hypothetical protein